MERALHRSILGHMCGASFCSTSVQRTPRRPRSSASVRPTGPAPTMRTSVSMRACVNCGLWRGRLLLGPFDVRPDRFLRVVDPAMRFGLLDHGAEIALPRGVACDLRALAQRLLVDPGGGLIRDFGGSGQRPPRLIEPRRAAFDQKLERAEIVAVFE